LKLVLDVLDGVNDLQISTSLWTNTVLAFISKRASLKEVFKRFLFTKPRKLTIVTWKIEIFPSQQISSIQSIQQQQPEKNLCLAWQEVFQSHEKCGIVG
jgi:hypothetical protein